MAFAELCRRLRSKIRITGTQESNFITTIQHNFISFYKLDKFYSCLTALLAAVPLIIAPTVATAMSDKTVQTGFMRTVMSAEYGANSRHGRTVKKYSGSVRVAIINHAKKNRRAEVKRFVRQVGSKVRGLRTGIVGSPKSANFVIHIVDKAQYGDVLRKYVYKNRRGPIRGRCYAHVRLGNRGIIQTSVVIVSDAGERIFKRCLVEEVLQGLGPLNDAAPARLSVFSGSSRHTSFTHYDQILMNVLYDPRVKAGMNKKEVMAVLPKVISDTRRRMP